MAVLAAKSLSEEEEKKKKKRNSLPPRYPLAVSKECNKDTVLGRKHLLWGEVVGWDWCITGSKIGLAGRRRKEFDGGRIRACSGLETSGHVSS